MEITSKKPTWGRRFVLDLQVLLGKNKRTGRFLVDSADRSHGGRSSSSTGCTVAWQGVSRDLQPGGFRGS
jgi:hypothetical protein